MSLAEELRRATLRSRAELLATITAVESVDEYGGDDIRVTYEYVHEESGVSIEATDSFAVPSSADSSNDFVRLCEAAHVPLGNAHEELVDTTVSITWTGSDWEIVLDAGESESGPDWSSLTATVFDAKLSPALTVAVAVAYPLVSPLVWVHLWARRGPARAAGVTVLLLVGWLLATVGLGVVLGVGPV